METKFLKAWDKIINKLESWLDILIVNIPNLLIALIVFTIFIILSKYTSKLVLKILGKSNLQKSMKKLISKIVSIIIIMAGLFLILGILNLSKTLNTILAGAGVAGLAVGLALQGALANTYSGIILSYIENLKFGDWIQSNGYEGEIVNMDLRVLTLKQKDNNLVYIPNKIVVDNPIKNYSSTPSSKVILSCGVGYSSDLSFVRNLTIKTLKENFDSNKNDDDIIFLYTEFGDSSINFEVRFWIDSRSALEVAIAKTQAIIIIKKVFDENEINIPFPIRTLDFPKEFSLEKNIAEK